MLPYLANYRLEEHQKPIASTHEPRYHLWFLKNKVKTEFWFDKKDIGVNYRELLGRCGVPAEVMEAHPAASGENFRCFFLHLGLATGLNPFLLQACFRREARRQLRDSQDAIQAAVRAAEVAPRDNEEQVREARRLEEIATEMVLATPDYLFEPVVKRDDYVDIEVSE